MKYQPSNGSEGMWFDEHFCSECKHDAKYRETEDAEDGCQILFNAMMYDISDKKYPKEWVYKNDHPTCTAYKGVEE